HSETHSMIFCSPAISGFVTPAYRRTLLLNRPQLSPLPTLRFLGPDALGAPVYPARSRMSAARRVTPPPEVHDRLVGFVAQNGGAAFFERLDWRARLGEQVGVPHGALMESEESRERAIEDELDRSRSILNQRLGTASVKHLCLPWGVS